MIHSDQTGFVKGRYIAQNIRLLSDLMEDLDHKNLSGIFLFIDFEKAFDTLEWNFILDTLKFFNFGPNFIKWFSTIYNGSQSAVMNGGNLTNYFEISRGVRQGCPPSPFLFILSVELLGLKIRQDPACIGIPLPNNTVANISQFADDTTIIASDTTSLKFCLQIINWFGSLSGLKLNKKKTQAMWLGSMKQSNSKILDFKSTKDPIKVLGAFLSYNQGKNIEANFFAKIRKMKTKLNLWLSRDLTLYGKSLLAKSLGVSQLTYTASMLSVPGNVIKLVQSQLFSFLWNNKKDKIKRSVMYQPLKYGGVSFVNFETVVKSLRLAWISRLLSDADEVWKAIPNHYLSQYGGLSFLLRCNFNPASIDKNLPLFYRELLFYFQELKQGKDLFPHGEYILWNKETITIENNSLVWKTWFDKGIYFVQDLLDSRGNFLSFSEFQNKFHVKSNYLHYFQLIAAIPSYLKKKAKDCKPTLDNLYSIIISPSPGSETTLDLANMRCKHYYKLFNENCINVPSGIKKWKDKFPEDITEWRNKFSFIYRSSRDNKLRQFSFKLLHRIIVTKKELKNYGLANNATCIFCQNPDSIEHAFLDCRVTTSFFSDAFAWFDQAHGSDLHFSSKEITFNDVTGTSASQVLDPATKHRLHLFIIYLKHYIYNCKSFETKLHFPEFRRKMLLQWQIEKCAPP